MVVLFDNKPAETTNEYRRIFSPPKEGALLTTDWAFWTIKPRHSQTFYVELSLYFDFSKSGSYKITFIRGTDPGQPDSVDVKSNTITITVLPANNPDPIPH